MKTPIQTARLAEVASLRDSLHKTPAYSKTGYPMIRVTDIRRGFLDVTDTKKVSPETFAEFTRGYQPTVGDILFSRVGSYGNSCFVDRKVDFCLGQNTVCISPQRARVNPYYLYCCLNSPSVKHQIESLVGGASQPTISLKSISSLILPTPVLSIQSKVASVLQAYDDLIANNTRRMAVLEEMAQSLYREWLAHFRFPGHEQAQVIETEQGRMPEGWSPTTVGDLAEDVRRGVQPGDVPTDTPYIGLEHLPRQSIALSEWGQAKDVASTKLAFRRGEILFGKIRPYFHKVGVAPVDGVCSSDAIVIVPRRPDYFGPVLCCVSSREFVDYATQTSQGTKMPRANWDVIRKFRLPTPPKPLLDHFNGIVVDAVANIRVLIFKNRNLCRTRDLLLPKLIAGELDVEHLDIDTGDPEVAPESVQAGGAA